LRSTTPLTRIDTVLLVVLLAVLAGVGVHELITMELEVDPVLGFPWTFLEAWWVWVPGSALVTLAWAFRELRKLDRATQED
jgi:hypothetical protein